MALFEVARHEPLTASPWDFDRVSAAIDAIVERSRRVFDQRGEWPSHPDDLGPLAPAATPGLYFGTAGIVWALAELGVRVPNDLALLRACAEEASRNIAGYGPGYEHGLLLSTMGIHLVANGLEQDPELDETLYGQVRANLDNPVREFMWGSPGSLLAARTRYDATSQPRWKAVYLEGAQMLFDTLGKSAETGARLWRQRLYGVEASYIGAVHGFAGNVAPIVAGRALLPDEAFARWRAVALATTRATAVREDGLANWPQSVDGGRPGRDAWLVQMCHGAPGMIIALGELIDGGDRDFDTLLTAGGELTWRAGPLAKGQGLCHGTAGNGYAFLRLYQQTHDERWLSRARAFAIHALEQSEAARAIHGDLRHSLWTGDLGTALFLRACQTLDPRFPTFGYC